ncbi:MAG: ferredoxin--NADP reductase [Bacteroidota bacterium]
MPNFHSLVISEIKQETPNAVSIELEIPQELAKTFQFKAGQYITFKHTIRDTEVRRAYSICCAPGDETIRVGVKKVKDGTFSVFANDELKVGDTLAVMPPEGNFVFEPNVSNQNTYAAFAAGSGITPVLSIIKDALEREPQSNFVLVYGNQSQAETMFHEELESLKDRYNDRFKIEYIYSRTKEYNAMQGRIDRSVVNYLLKNKYAETEFETFYLCGPEVMIQTVTETLEERGVSKDVILFELFTSSEDGSLTEVHEGNTKVTVTLDDETDSFVMSQKKCVLDAALDHGLDAPFSCQGGICSTCIARVTKGEVEMRKNQILTDSELAEGLILACQAHPTTAELVIDFDDV